MSAVRVRRRLDLFRLAGAVAVVGLAIYLGVPALLLASVFGMAP